MKKQLLVLIATLICSHLFSQQVSVEKAMKVAKNCYYEKGFSKTKIEYNSIKLQAHKAVTNDKKTPLFYIFNDNTNNGFIIISATKNSQPILAYSFENIFEDDIHNPAALAMFDYYERELNYIINNGIEADAAIKEVWNLYSSDSFFDSKSTLKNIDEVVPMITTEWGQSCYYNSLCPEDTAGYCDHAIVGCVAVAMGQVMKYHNWPDIGDGSYQYIHPVYETIYANFNTSTYIWDSMPNSLEKENFNIAQLLFHCGVSVDMNYGPNSSGAHTGKIGSSLIRHFNYKPDSKYLQKDKFTSVEWVQILKDELDNSRPIVYRGYDDSENGGGHAFNIDGYQEDMFHLNWGWYGSYNGYYTLTNLVPGDYDFSNYILITYRNPKSRV